MEDIAPKTDDQRAPKPHVLLIDAPDAGALRAQAARMADRLAERPEDLTLVCSSSVQPKQPATGVRWAVAAHDVQSLISELRAEAPSPKTFEAHTTGAHRPKLLFLYVLCLGFSAADDLSAEDAGTLDRDQSLQAHGTRCIARTACFLWHSMKYVQRRCRSTGLSWRWLSSSSQTLLVSRSRTCCTPNQASSPFR